MSFLCFGLWRQVYSICPRYNLIAVVTSDPYVDWNVADDHEQAVLEIIADYIIPAVMN